MIVTTFLFVKCYTVRRRTIFSGISKKRTWRSQESLDKKKMKARG